MKNLVWKQIIITFAISFVLGAAFGRFEFSHNMRNRWKDPEARQKWVLKKMTDKLKLSAEQQGKAAVILRDTAPQREAVRDEMKPKFEAIRLQVRERMTPFLTPGQVVQYDEMEKDWQEKHDRRGKF